MARDTHAVPVAVIVEGKHGVPLSKVEDEGLRFSHDEECLSLGAISLDLRRKISIHKMPPRME